MMRFVWTILKFLSTFFSFNYILHNKYEYTTNSLFRNMRGKFNRGEKTRIFRVKKKRKKEIIVLSIDLITRQVQL